MHVDKKHTNLAQGTIFIESDTPSNLAQDTIFIESNASSVIFRKE